MTENEKKLLCMIRDNDEPERAILIAASIILKHLEQHESFAEPSPFDLLEHA